VRYENGEAGIVAGSSIRREGDEAEAAAEAEAGMV
jgi:hypothetical protein